MLQDTHKLSGDQTEHRTCDRVSFQDYSWHEPAGQSSRRQDGLGNL